MRDEPKESRVDCVTSQKSVCEGGYRYGTRVVNNLPVLVASFLTRWGFGKHRMQKIPGIADYRRTKIIFSKRDRSSNVPTGPEIFF